MRPFPRMSCSNTTSSDKRKRRGEEEEEHDDGGGEDRSIKSRRKDHPDTSDEETEAAVHHDEEDSDEKKKDCCPCCTPLITLSSLLDWTPPPATTECPGGGHDRPLPLESNTRNTNRRKSKVIVCHDLMGGYLPNDRSCCQSNKSVGHSDREQPYEFSHWNLIDTFIYFSHHLVTIPPPVWIRDAHSHNVPILGTFITESKEGEETCKQLLSSEQMVSSVTDKLVDICDHFNFDGWLLNIENVIEPDKIDNLVLFVSSLKQKMRLLNERRGVNVDTGVIWYDSVIHPTGKLDWQNGLNDKNERFFRASDGIFLNYCWNQDTLKQSLEQLEKLKEEEKTMNLNANNIFVGIDVFGRGCFGGGGWNTNLAIQEIRNVNPDLSFAIFAPGWVHEALGSKDFHKNNEEFWNKLGLLSPVPI